MARGRPKKPIILSEQAREQLTSIVRSHSLPHGLVRRAQVILMAAEGTNNSEIAAKVGLSNQSVGKWRQRYLQAGLSGHVKAVKKRQPPFLYLE